MLQSRIFGKETHTPNSIAGRPTTLGEKSRDCVNKGGTSPIEVVMSMGKNNEEGLVNMNTPAHDIE